MYTHKHTGRGVGGEDNSRERGAARGGAQEKTGQGGCISQVNHSEKLISVVPLYSIHTVCVCVCVCVSVCVCECVCVSVCVCVCVCSICIYTGALTFEDFCQGSNARKRRMMSALSQRQRARRPLRSPMRSTSEPMLPPSRSWLVHTLRHICTHAYITILIQYD